MSEEISEDLLEIDPQTYRVQRLNWAGLGVVKVEGRERCVPLTRVGEQVRVRWHVGAWGKITGERVEMSDDERQSLDDTLTCDQGRRCSGCSLRHLSAEEQRDVQRESHIGALRRLSGRALIPIEEGGEIEMEWLGAAPREGYRTRVTAGIRLLSSVDSVDPVDSSWGLGLRSRWGAPIDLSRCPHHPEILQNLVRCVNEWFTHYAVSLTIEEQSHHFRLNRVSLQAGSDLPLWVTLHLEDQRREGSLSRKEQERRLNRGEALWGHLPISELLQALSSYGEISIFGDLSLRDQARSARPLYNLGGPIKSVWRCDRGYDFTVRPAAWLPQSPATLELLRVAVARCLWGEDQVQEESSGRVFELGCGVGLLSLALLMERPKIHWLGVDIESVSAECAQESALRLGLGARARFWGADGRRALGTLSSDEKPDLLVIHAMRKPITGLLKLAAHLNIKKVCYLAPSAPSLGRDLAECEAYQVERLLWVDQMPGTAQLMTIAQLQLTSSPCLL